MAGLNSMTALIIPISSSSAPPKPQPPGGGTAPGAPDQTLPGDLPTPEHPIYYPLPPGAPVDPSYGIPIEHPDQGLPQEPPRPSQGPGMPTHPIVLPPGEGGGWLPIYIWGGGNVPGVSPPIHIPPEGETEDGAKIEWKAAWTPTTGWVSFAIVVPGAGATVPTPSKRR